MDLFFRIFQHLLPDALAWRIRKRAGGWKIGDGSKIGEPGLLIGSKPGGRTIDRLFQGLSTALQSARDYVDAVYLDLFPATTRELDKWEHQFGLLRAASDADRRKNVDAAWKSTGGQSPGYLQGVVQSAGFDLYIHEWWNTPGNHDPRTYTQVPLVGTVQCGEPLALCGEPTALCDNFLANEPGYLVNNLRASGVAPPAITDDPNAWPYFLYWGAATFPNKAQVPVARRAELERLLLKLCPSQQWLVVLVDYV